MNVICRRQLPLILQHSSSCIQSVQSIKLVRLYWPNSITSTIMSKPRFYSRDVPQLTRAEKLKQAFKDYGATVLLFHIGMSLCSLGVWYLVVSSGVDVPNLLRKINIDESKLQIASGASTFFVAYALHKMTAPIRISITLGSAPFIVNYLRRIGVLKMKKTVEPLKHTHKHSESSPSSSTKL